MTVTAMEGKTYGRLTFLSRAGSTPLGQATWHARCECGTEVIVSGAMARKGHVRSCGCLHKDTITTHGMNNTPTYFAWQSMKSRCASNPHYAKVEICEEWLNSFEAFLRDMGECEKGITLDRIDNEKGYNPDNCRWASKKEQTRNRRCNKLDPDKAAAIRNDTRHPKLIAEDYGIHPYTVGEVKRGKIWAA